jgi:hypothetical protein
MVAKLPAAEDRVGFAIALVLFVAMFAAGVLRVSLSATSDRPTIDFVVRGGF